MNHMPDTGSRAWGSGMFKDIANIRRGVYTEYYVMVEHADTMREILGETPEGHCRRLLKAVESPEYNIDQYNYEEIKAYLWREARQEFGSEIQRWLDKKQEVFRLHAQEQLIRFSESLILPPADWREAVLVATALNLFDLMAKPDYKTVLPRIIQAADNEGALDGLIMAIDFFDAFHQNVVQKPQHLILLPGDIATLAIDLKLYGECLLEHWSMSDSACKITVLVNENYCPRNNNKAIQRNATRTDVESALQFAGLEKLREYQGAGLFEVRSFVGEFSGTVESDLKAEGMNILQSADAVLALGEQNNITLPLLPVDSFRLFPIRDFSSIFYTGIKNNTEEHKYPKLAVLHVPAGIRPAIDYVPDLRTELDAQNYDQIYRALSPEHWRALIETARRDHNGNVLSALRNSSSFNPVEYRSLARLIEGTGAADRIAQEVLGEFDGVYRRLSTPLGGGVERAHHIAYFPQGRRNARGERLDLGVAFANQIKNYRDLPKSLLTYEDVQRNVSGALFGFNMLYFITRNLILKFNQVNPHFNLHESFFGEYVDFLKFPGAQKELFYPSLYNKGAFGLKPDGTFEFGRIQLPARGTVTLPIGRDRIPLQWESVNPLSDFSKQIAMFTPNQPRYADPNLRAPHFVGSTRTLFMLPENDHYNFVFINDILLGVVRGSTEIPPFGTVLSVPETMFSGEIKAQLERQVVAAGEKRLAAKDQHVRFDFALDQKWADCAWIMGGALLMVNEGKTESLDFEKDNSSNSVYCIEGWDLESSQRTQETPVETNLNEARMTVGLTESGHFFISVIDGRANNRTGATHVETVAWIQEYFDKQNTRVRFALDLDSASSVSLGVFRDGDFLLLNQTARGSDSKLCDTRYYNHLGYLAKVAA